MTTPWRPIRGFSVSAAEAASMLRSRKTWVEKPYPPPPDRLEGWAAAPSSGVMR